MYNHVINPKKRERRYQRGKLTCNKNRKHHGQKLNNRGQTKDQQKHTTPWPKIKQINKNY